MSRAYVAFFSTSYALDAEEISRRRADDAELASASVIDERLSRLLTRPFYRFETIASDDEVIRLRYRRVPHVAPDAVFPWLVDQELRLFDERARWRLVAELRIVARRSRGGASGELECLLLAGQRV